MQAIDVDDDDDGESHETLPAGIFNYFDYFRCTKDVKRCALARHAEW